MNAAHLLLTALGGMFGAWARYGFSAWLNQRVPSVLPLAILLINLSGSFLLGVIAGWDGNEDVRLLFGTGFLGAYTTFSTFNVDNVQLIRRQAWKELAVNLLASYLFGIALAYAGYGLGERFSAS